MIERRWNQLVTEKNGKRYINWPTQILLFFVYFSVFSICYTISIRHGDYKEIKTFIYGFLLFMCLLSISALTVAQLHPTKENASPNSAKRPNIR